MQKKMGSKSLPDGVGWKCSQTCIDGMKLKVNNGGTDQTDNDGTKKKANDGGLEEEDRQW